MKAKFRGAEFTDTEVSKDHDAPSKRDGEREGGKEKGRGEEEEKEGGRREGGR